MPRRRLEQLLSSSLRYHLSMVFAEEEGGSSTLLTSIQARVRESAAANGFEVNLAEGAEESFSAVVSAELLRVRVRVSVSVRERVRVRVRVR